MVFLKFLKKEKNPITTQKVRFSYDTKEILKDISLKIKNHEIISIVGKSGSGKSTFLKLVAGILPGKYYGSIKIFGRSKIFKKSSMGFVPQEMSFIPDLNVSDNIKIAGLNFGVSEKKAMEKAIEIMNFLKFEEKIDKKPTELSGGQKVRLNIILSLLHDPKIIILDEPFVGLDFSNRKLLWHFIESMKKKKKSVILTSHLLKELQENIDRLILLKNGKVFFRGKFENLKQKLNMEYVLEVKISKLSKSKKEKLRKYCVYKEINIIDDYGGYFMFALKEEKEKQLIHQLFNKLNLNYRDIGFREPNLDEIFLNA
jgi:ABC-2 type transport system ATP-binding protein